MVAANRSMSKDFFSLFNLSQRFDIDRTALERSYLSLQQAFHPDRFAGVSETERLSATQQSMRINEGYDILKSPLRRAEYLLSLHDVIVNRDGAGVKPTGCLLMEMMEQREELSEATTLEEVQSQTIQVQQQSTAVIDKLTDLFAAEAFESAAQEVIRLRYYEKFLEEARIKTLQLRRAMAVSD